MADESVKITFDPSKIAPQEAPAPEESPISKFWKLARSPISELVPHGSDVIDAATSQYPKEQTEPTSIVGKILKGARTFLGPFSGQDMGLTALEAGKRVSPIDVAGAASVGAGKVGVAANAAVAGSGIQHLMEGHPIIGALETLGGLVGGGSAIGSTINKAKAAKGAFGPNLPTMTELEKAITSGREMAPIEENMAKDAIFKENDNSGRITSALNNRQNKMNLLKQLQAPAKAAEAEEKAKGALPTIVKSEMERTRPIMDLIEQSNVRGLTPEEQASIDAEIQAYPKGVVAQKLGVPKAGTTVLGAKKAEAAASKQVSTEKVAEAKTQEGYNKGVATNNTRAQRAMTKALVEPEKAQEAANKMRAGEEQQAARAQQGVIDEATKARNKEIADRMKAWEQEAKNLNIGQAKDAEIADVINQNKRMAELGQPIPDENNIKGSVTVSAPAAGGGKQTAKIPLTYPIPQGLRELQGSLMAGDPEAIAGYVDRLHENYGDMADEMSKSILADKMGFPEDHPAVVNVYKHMHPEAEAEAAATGATAGETPTTPEPDTAAAPHEALVGQVFPNRKAAAKAINDLKAGEHLDTAPAAKGGLTRIIKRGQPQAKLVPEITAPDVPVGLKPADERMFQEHLADAKANGYTGDEGALRDKFAKGLNDARNFIYGRGPNGIGGNLQNVLERGIGIRKGEPWWQGTGEPLPHAEVGPEAIEVEPPTGQPEEPATPPAPPEEPPAPTPAPVAPKPPTPPAPAAAEVAPEGAYRMMVAADRTGMKQYNVIGPDNRTARIFDTPEKAQAFIDSKTPTAPQTEPEMSVQDFGKAIAEEGNKPLVELPQQGLNLTAPETPAPKQENLLGPKPKKVSSKQAKKSEGPALDLTPETTTQPVVDTAEDKGVFPAKMFKSPLEAAGSNYGDVKAAIKAGEKVPEEGRAAAGRAAQRLNKEAQTAAPAKPSTNDQAALDAMDRLSPEGKQKLLETLKKLGGEKGAATLMPQLRIASGLTGAAYGGAIDPNGKYSTGSRLGNALAYGAGAAMLPSVAKMIPESGLFGENKDRMKSIGTFINTLHNSSLLGPYSVLKKAAGDVGGLTSAALENPDRAGALLSSLLSPKTWREAGQGFKEGFVGPQEAEAGLENLPTHIYSPLGLSGRLMGGLTRGTKQILENANFSPAEQQYYTLTAYPRTKLGGDVYETMRRNPALQYLSPFARIGINRLERTVERSPLGLLKLINETDPETRAQILSRVGTGTAATGAAYEMTPEDFVKEHPTAASSISSVGGPLGLLMLAGMAAKTSGKSPTGEVTREISRDIPGLRPLEEFTTDPEGLIRNHLAGYTNWLAGYAHLQDYLNGKKVEPDIAGKDLPNLGGAPMGLGGKFTNKMWSNVPGIREELPTKPVKFKFNAGKLRFKP